MASDVVGPEAVTGGVVVAPVVTLPAVEAVAPDDDVPEGSGWEGSSPAGPRAPPQAGQASIAAARAQVARLT